MYIIFLHEYSVHQHPRMLIATTPLAARFMPVNSLKAAATNDNGMHRLILHDGKNKQEVRKDNTAAVTFRRWQMATTKSCGLMKMLMLICHKHHKKPTKIKHQNKHYF